MVRRVDAFGEVAAGQSLAVSFARAGQITQLTVVAGSRVAKGARLATLTPDPATQQAYQQALTAVDAARREWQRQQDLLKLQLATQSQVDAAEKAYRDATSNVTALDQTGGGSRESVAVAPFDGVVLTVAAVQGDRLAAGAPLLTIGHTDTVRVLLGIDPAYRALVSRGTPVRIQPFTSIGAAQATIDAVVSDAQDTVDPKTLLIPAVVVLGSPASTGLVPGMKVRATLDVGSQVALSAPRDAVLSDERGSYVFQVVDGKAHRVQVTVGMRSGDRVAIDGVPDPSLPLVVVGNYELEDGMAVKEAAR